ncbi:MAG: hypothetical protein GXP63_03045 [DPANN group archaeon]|nr:hypothetical protein [DPANN group archaeon]
MKSASAHAKTASADDFFLRVKPVQAYLIEMAFGVIGGTIIGIMTFLQTYLHFPKMERQKRIALSVKNATIMGVAMTAIVVIIFQVMFRLV